MNELIRVSYDDGRPTVSARELHEFLGVKTAYKDWFPRMCEYGFAEGQDFCSFLSESTGGRPAQDAQLTIEMAKEICMLQRNERGDQAQKYFAQLEKDWDSPEMIMARALRIANRKLRFLKEENMWQKKLIDKLKDSGDCVVRSMMALNGNTTSGIANNYGVSAKHFNFLLRDLGIQHIIDNQWVLCDEYLNKGYTVDRMALVFCSSGATKTVDEILWTAKGVEFLDKTLQERTVLRRVGDKTVLFKCGECNNRWFCEIEPEQCDWCLDQ